MKNIKASLQNIRVLQWKAKRVVIASFTLCVCLICYCISIYHIQQKRTLHYPLFKDTWIQTVSFMLSALLFYVYTFTLTTSFIQLCKVDVALIYSGNQYENVFTTHLRHHQKANEETSNRNTEKEMFTTTVVLKEVRIHVGDGSDQCLQTYELR